MCDYIWYDEDDERYNESYYAGIRVGRNKEVKFNWNESKASHDILTITGELSGEFDSDNMRYIYAYTYTSKATNAAKKAIYNYIKELESADKMVSDDMTYFINYGLLSLEQFGSYDDYDARVETYHFDGKLTLLNVIYVNSDTYIEDNTPNRWISIDRLLKLYNNIDLNIEKVAETLHSRGLSKQAIDEKVSLVREKFDNLKQTRELFKMKEFMQKEIQQDLCDYLKFQSDNERELYFDLQGINVITFNDFTPTDDTFKEIARYLKSINEKNTLTVFVLIKYDEK